MIIKVLGYVILKAERGWTMFSEERQFSNIERFYDRCALIKYLFFFHIWRLTLVTMVVFQTERQTDTSEFPLPDPILTV
jgi:hypothetical protein